MRARLGAVGAWFRNAGRGSALALGLTLPVAAHAQAVEEGLVVRQLAFTGNHAFDSELLRAAIATTKSSDFATLPVIKLLGLGAKRRLNQREFRADVLRLPLFYAIRGYLDARVDTAVIRTERDVYITFHIREGQPVRVRTLEIKGLDSIPKRRELTANLPLRLEQPFDRTLLLATADTIQSRLQDGGYPEAVVLLERREVDREHHTADVSLLVEPGVPAVIGPIQVNGTRQIDSAFVRNLLVTAPGRSFSAQALAESQRNLYRSELFRYASVQLDTAHYVAGSGVVPLTIQLTEGSLHRAQAALGYGTNDCFRTGIGWTARNALGRGQIFDASAQVSKLGVGRPFGVGLEKSWLCSALKDDSVGSTRANYNITGSFRRPAFISPSNIITFSLFAERRSEFAVYLREDVGGSIALSRETEKRIPISVVYRLSYGRTEANPVSFCAFFNACTETDIQQLRDRRLIATLTLGVQRTRVNNPLDPVRGSALSAEATYSSNLIGSSRFAQFTRFAGDASLYQPMGNVVLGLHVRSGMVFAPRLVLGGGAANFIPPEQRFYAGGPNDVRGFNRNELGPLVYVVRQSAVAVDGSVNEDSVRVVPTGGNTLVVGNAELRVPSPVFPGRFRLAGFVDAGTVWERGGGPGSGPALRFTPGVGLRFVTPLGPARMDVAYNPYNLPSGRLYAIQSSGDLLLLGEDYRRTRRTGRGWVLQFGVGQAF